MVIFCRWVVVKLSCTYEKHLKIIFVLRAIRRGGLNEIMLVLSFCRSEEEHLD